MKKLTLLLIAALSLSTANIFAASATPAPTTVVGSGSSSAAASAVAAEDKSAATGKQTALSAQQRAKLQANAATLQALEKQPDSSTLWRIAAFLPNQTGKGLSFAWKHKSKVMPHNIAKALWRNKGKVAAATAAVYLATRGIQSHNAGGSATGLVVSDYNNYAAPGATMIINEARCMATTDCHTETGKAADRVVARVATMVGHNYQTREEARQEKAAAIKAAQDKEIAEKAKAAQDKAAAIKAKSIAEKCSQRKAARKMKKQDIKLRNEMFSQLSENQPSYLDQAVTAVGNGASYVGNGIVDTAQACVDNIYCRFIAGAATAPAGLAFAIGTALE